MSPEAHLIRSAEAVLEASFQSSPSLNQPPASTKTEEKNLHKSGRQLTTRTYRTINPKTEAAHWLAY
jgi:hypothetical protein